MHNTEGVQHENLFCQPQVQKCDQMINPTTGRSRITARDNRKENFFEFSSIACSLRCFYAGRRGDKSLGRVAAKVGLSSVVTDPM